MLDKTIHSHRMLSRSTSSCNRKRRSSFRMNETPSKVASGDLPTLQYRHSFDSSGQRPQRQRLLIGCISPRASEKSQHWNSFYKRFQTKKKRLESPGVEDGMLSRMATRIFSDCTRPQSLDEPDEWTDVEMPLHRHSEVMRQAQWQFWKDEFDQDCRVELTK